MATLSKINRRHLLKMTGLSSAGFALHTLIPPQPRGLMPSAQPKRQPVQPWP